MMSGFRRQRLIDRWCRGTYRGIPVTMTGDLLEKVCSPAAVTSYNRLIYNGDPTYVGYKPEVIHYLNTHISRGERIQSVWKTDKAVLYFCLPEDAVEFKLTFL